jgi:hypothetical protein
MQHKPCQILVGRRNSSTLAFDERIEAASPEVLVATQDLAACQVCSVVQLQQIYLRMSSFVVMYDSRSLHVVMTQQCGMLIWKEPRCMHGVRKHPTVIFPDQVSKRRGVQHSFSCYAG